MGTESHTSEDNRSRLERVHARWLAPIFGVVGVVAAVVGIVVGVRSCTTDDTAKTPTAGRVYEASKVGDGWGPQRALFTSDNTSPDGALNSITDNPVAGDERNFTRCRLPKDAVSGDSVSATDGTIIKVTALLENASTRTTANIVNTHMQLIVDKVATDDPGVEISFTGVRQSDGAKQEVWDGCRITSDRPLRLVLVPGSATVLPAPKGTPAFPIGDGVITGASPIPEIKGVAREGEVPGNDNMWGYFDFDLIAVA